MKRASEKEQVNSAKKVKVDATPDRGHNEEEVRTGDNHFDASAIDEELDEEDLDELISSQEEPEQEEFQVQAGSLSPIHEVGVNGQVVEESEKENEPPNNRPNGVQREIETIVLDSSDEDDAHIPTTTITIERTPNSPSPSPQPISPQTTTENIPHPPSPKIMTTKRHFPVRQTRSKVVTYNDIANSADPNEFRSEGEDDIRPTTRASSSKHNPQPKLHVTLATRRRLKTGFVYDTAMSYHATPDPMEIHPEDPSRIFRIFQLIERHKLLVDCQRIPSRRATKQEILLVHNILHYRKLRETEDLKTRHEYMAMEKEYDSIYLNSNSFESALYAVGSLINLLQAVVTNQVKNAFAIIRPPGHHAETDIPMGFCLFNNVAIATRDSMQRLGVKKTLILDWDIHFGNGTQSIFSEDPNVLYISLHRFERASFYPSDVKGAAEYTGHGKGEGKTVNIPWPCSGLTDADYVHAFREVVMPIATEFHPDVVIVSAGFDAALNDPIGQCNVTPAGYGQMTHMLKGLADGKIVIALEGGYNLDSIAVSAVACMNVLLGEAPEAIQDGLVPKKECFETVELVKSIQKKYWRCFGN